MARLLSQTYLYARTVAPVALARQSAATYFLVCSCRVLSLWHEHDQTLAGAAGFDEFAHRQRVAAVAAMFQLRHDLGRAFGQDDIAPENDSVARKVQRFFRRDID